LSLRYLRVIPASVIQNLETALVLLIGLHSLILGFAMLFLPTHTLNLFGWEYQGPMFFPSQAGVFLTLLGILFVTFIWYRRLIWFIILVKSVAVVFLLSQNCILGPAAPSTILVAAILDGLMGLSIAVILILRLLTINDK
jgi:hypothetical protein